MTSVVINILNQIGLAEGQPSQIIFYGHKGNPVGDYDNNISVVDKAPDITGVDEETDEQNLYDTKHEDSQF